MSDELNRVFDKIDETRKELGGKMDVNAEKTRLILEDHGIRINNVEKVQEDCKEDKKIQKIAMANVKWGLIYKVAAIILGLALVGLLVL